jgi:hypothetical protein
MKRIKLDPAVSLAALSTSMDEATTDNSAITPTTEQTIPRPTGFTAISPILNLLSIQSELLVYILKDLSAEEIVRFQTVAKPFYDVLSKDFQANALLKRSQFITKWEVYDEKSKTLDLTKVIHTESYNRLSDLRLADDPNIRCIFNGYEEPVNLIYQNFLNDTVELLSQQPEWAAAHIHKLSVPIQTGFYLYDFSATMEQLAALLPGVKEMTLADCTKCFAPWDGTEDIDEDGLMCYLEALKKMPVEKVTIQTSNFYPSSALLYQAINKGCLSEKISRLVFLYKMANEQRSFESITLEDNGFYPNLTCLSLYTNTAPNRCYTFDLRMLPSTVTHLRTHSQVLITGQARGIKNLHIADHGYGYSQDYAIFQTLQDTLPALEKIHVVPHGLPKMHNLMLSALAHAPSRPISIEFPTLHLSLPSLLAGLQEKFTNGVSIQDTLRVHIASSEHLQDFVTLAQQGSFINLPHIEFASDILNNHFYLPFVKSIQSLLQQGVLPRLTKLTLTYQYQPIALPAHYEDNTQFPNAPELLLTPEIKYFALMTESKFSFQQLLSEKGLRSLRASFTNIEPKIKKLMQEQYISTDKQDHFFNALYQEFDAFLAAYPLTEQAVTYDRGLSIIEEIHDNLYLIYSNELRQFMLEHSQKMIDSLFGKLVWGEQIFSHYQTHLPQCFQETKFGEEVLLRANHFILGTLVDFLCNQIHPLLPEFALSSPTPGRLSFLTEKGFTIDFYKHPEIIERQKKRKFSVVEEIPTPTTTDAQAS